MKACNQCGKCCIKYGAGGLSVSAEQLAYWQDHRPDLFRYVQQGEIWMDPETGKPIEVCPWLGKAPDSHRYTCDIYYDRPDDCRFYPSTIDEMRADGCEMLETRDLSNLKKARRALDKMMADSRTPFEQG